MRTANLMGALAGLAIAAGTQAAVTFTFFDPGAGPEIEHFSGTDETKNPGVLTWIGAPVTLTIDGTANGLGIVQFTAEIAMELTVGAVLSEEGGIFVAPILGGTISFSDTVSEANILFATLGIEAGALLALGTTGNIIAQGDGSPGGLFWTAGEALDLFLGGQNLLPIFDANFTLTNITPGVSLNEDGFLTAFTANSAFTGNAVIPSPGALTLMSLAGILVARRAR